MKKSICGAECDNCGYGKNNGCMGCTQTKGCPFGKQCFIAKRITAYGTDGYNLFKEKLIEEFNSLDISGMPKINELFPLNGAFVNLAYPMPGGNTVKLLDDNEIYLGSQVECKCNDGDTDKCFGLIAAENFLAVAEYGENGTNPELIVYRRRQNE